MIQIKCNEKDFRVISKYKNYLQKKYNTELIITADKYIKQFKPEANNL